MHTNHVCGQALCTSHDKGWENIVYTHIYLNRGQHMIAVRMKLLQDAFPK